MKGPEQNHILLNNLLFSCTEVQARGYEQFVQEHSLGYIISGEIHILGSGGSNIGKAGHIGLVRRNQLLKSLKVPPPGGQFRAVNIIFTQDALRRYASENNIVVKEKYTGAPLLTLHDNLFIKGFFESLVPYFDDPRHLTDALIDLKTKEAIELLLQHDPRFKDFLFDFTEPYKIDLEAFMNQNYMYNVSAGHFARLTGRSLAGFKRDFEKIFNAAPGKWLQQKRLSEAHYLIKEKGKKPSDVYLDVGFENLSHFSFAFKKAYGVSPSLVKQG